MKKYNLRSILGLLQLACVFTGVACSQMDQIPSAGMMTYKTGKTEAYTYHKIKIKDQYPLKGKSITNPTQEDLLQYKNWILSQYPPINPSPPREEGIITMGFEELGCLREVLSTTQNCLLNANIIKEHCDIINRYCFGSPYFLFGSLFKDLRRGGEFFCIRSNGIPEGSIILIKMQGTNNWTGVLPSNYCNPMDVPDQGGLSRILLKQGDGLPVKIPHSHYLSSLADTENISTEFFLQGKGKKIVSFELNNGGRVHVLELKEEENNQIVPLFSEGTSFSDPTLNSRCLRLLNGNDGGDIRREVKTCGTNGIIVIKEQFLGPFIKVENDKEYPIKRNQGLCGLIFLQDFKKDKPKNKAKKDCIIL